MHLMCTIHTGMVLFRTKITAKIFHMTRERKKVTVMEMIEAMMSRRSKEEIRRRQMEKKRWKRFVYCHFLT